MAFHFETSDATALKQALKVLKLEDISIRARKDVKQVLFSCCNRNTGLLFLHKMTGRVEEDQDFAVSAERFAPLLTKDALTLHFNGSSLEYKSGRFKGTVETLKPFFEEWPKLQANGVTVQSVLEEFAYLSLSSKNHEIFVFGGHYQGTPALAAGDSEHVVFIPLSQSSDFTLPFAAVHAAQRLFKTNVHAVIDHGTVYFKSHTDRSASLLRFGQVADTGSLDLKAFGDLVSMDDQWTVDIESDVLTDILDSYRTVADAERTGLLTLVSTGTELTLTAKTRHGEQSRSCDVNGGAGEVTLNMDLLKDIHRLEATVTIGVKASGQVFFIKNPKATFCCGVA